MVSGTPGRPAHAAPASPLGYLVYYVLLALNLAGLLMFLWVNQLLQDGYIELAHGNAGWTLASQRTAALTKAARDANAPVNEVFNTGNVDVEKERLGLALADLFARVRQESEALGALPNASQSHRLLFNLQQAETHLRRMETASLRVFDDFAAGRKKSADSAMAMADRKLGDFLDVMAQRDLIIQGIESDLFLQGEQYRSGLSQVVRSGICILAALAALFSFYGIRLTRATQRAAREAIAAGEALALSEAQRRKLNDEREHLLASRQKFIADAAHQLRTPVAGMRLQIDHVLRSQDPAVLRPALERLHGATERVVRLSNQLLALASAEAGATDSTTFSEVDLVALVREVGLRSIPVAQGRNIDLGLDAPAGAVPVLGNPVLLGELVSNLVDNAVRYCPDFGCITLTVRDQPAPEVVVEDTGPGVPREEREKVFERFHRVLGSPGNGAGLGLAIVRDIARLHGAQATLADGAAGRGLRASVVFQNKK
ncbi:MAG: HAMP domain-containing sensor histidine kinase [Betaproteobacteria bacterium]